MDIKNKLFVLTSVLVFAAGNSFAGDPGTVKWSQPFPTYGPVNGSPAVGLSNIIYITSQDPATDYTFLYAIYPATGQRVWQSPVVLSLFQPYPAELLPSPAVAADGSIYVASGNTLYSVNPNGNYNWSLQVGGGGYSAAVAVASNGTVYVTYDDDINLYAVEPSPDNTRGIPKWTLPIYSLTELDSPPTVGPDGTIYLYGVADKGHNNRETLFAIEDQNCSAGVKWTADLGFAEEENDFQSTLVLDNAGRIYAPYGPGSTGLMAFNTSDGSRAWYYPFIPPSGAAIQSSPAIAADGTIYVGANDGLLYALNTNGTLKWKFNTETGSPIHSSPALAADGTIAFGVSNRLWDIIDAGTDGALEWTYPDVLNQPALSGDILSSPLITGTDNTIYFGCEDHNVYAVYGSAPLANSPWPRFRRDAAGSASAAPNIVLPDVWVGGVVVWGVTNAVTNIYKGVTGFNVSYGGSTTITLSRNSCSSSYSTNLLVTFFLGGTGNAFSSPNYHYNPAYAYNQLDFTVTGCSQAPFPNGFFVIFQPGQTQATIVIQTVDSFDYNFVQLLPFNIPTGQTGFGVNAAEAGGQATIFVHPDQNQ